MGYRELLPHPALRPYVDRFWSRTAGALDGAPEPEAESTARILPDGCIDILIDVSTGAARVVGTMTRAVVYRGGASDLCAVRFRPGGATPFLRVPALELTDRVVPADELGASWLEPLGAGCAAGHRNPSTSGVLAELEARLLARLGSVVQDPRVRYATSRLLQGNAPSIEALARELGQSRQQLGRTFRHELGLSPKELSRVARLQRAVDRLQAAPSEGLAVAAVALGYYDQAHMTRDFQALAGLTPQAARRAGGSIFPIRSLWLEA